MSFTAEVKNEVSKLELNKTDSLSELSGIMHEFKDLKVTTENASVARRIFKIVKDIYKVNAVITVRKGYNYHKNYIYILEIKQKKDIIINDLNLNNPILDNYLVDDEYLLRAYLRGLFLICGSINDPKKSRYHLEFVVNDLDYANFISDKLNYFNLNSKVIKRDLKYMVYIKEAEKIGDFLRIINATSAVLYYEDIRIYRDHKNMTNRLNNCEQANVDKIIQTAFNQVKDINKIKNEFGNLDILDDKTRIIAEYRLKYPEASLQELSEIIGVETESKLSKSGVYHRMKKITEIAERIK